MTIGYQLLKNWICGQAFLVTPFFATNNVYLMMDIVPTSVSTLAQSYKIMHDDYVFCEWMLVWCQFIMIYWHCCFDNLHESQEIDSQTWHWWGFSPVWRRICTTSMYWALKGFCSRIHPSHSQTNNFLLLATWSWFKCCNAQLIKKTFF